MEYEKIALNYFSWFSRHFRGARKVKDLKIEHQTFRLKITEGFEHTHFNNVELAGFYQKIESTEKYANVLRTVANRSMLDYGIDEQRTSYDWDKTFSSVHEKSISFSDHEGLMIDASTGDQKNAVVYLRFYKTNKHSGERIFSVSNNPIVFLQKDDMEWKIVDIEIEND